MPKIGSVADLQALREQLKKDFSRRTQTNTTVTVGMGTCGIAAGARDTMQAILDELDKRGITAHVQTVGCIGMCSNEPLVDIEQAGKPRITYGNITSDRVPHLIEEHLIKGTVVEDWTVGRLRPSDED